MRTRTFVLLPFLLCLLPAARTAADDDKPARTLLKEDFNQGNAGDLANKLLSHRRIRLARNAGPDGSDAIRVSYAGYRGGSRRVVVRYPLGAKVEQAALSFDVCFEEDFQWALGGKLHGLGPKHPVTGGNPRRPDGWSARILFREDGKCATYLYDQNEEKKFGIGQTTDEPVFQAGKWHHVVLQVRLNDADESDGYARILVDSQEVIDTEGVEFRGNDDDDTRIEQFLFSTFHGGNSLEWAPVNGWGIPITVHALFDNFEVTEGIQP